jgi:broad specificity phosphatase PhoE
LATTIILVRHGSTAHLGHRLSGRMLGVALNAQGRDEAAAAGRLLATRGVSLVRHSPVDRAAETAAIVAAACGVATEPDALLTEVDFGRWTGASFAELGDDPDWRLWNIERGSARAPDGETMAQAQARIVAAIDAAVRDRDGDTIAMVGHSDVIRAGIAAVLGLPLDRLLSFDVDPASLSTIVAGPGWARLVRMNEVAA